MNIADQREPTNDELWSQPPAQAPAAPQPGALAPLQPATTPVPVTPQPPPERATTRGQDWPALILAIVSIMLAIPLTAIASVNIGVPGVVFTWLGIVGVNFAYNFRKR